MKFSAAGLVLACFAFSTPAHASDNVEAKKELFAARYENAAVLYSKVVAQQPADGDAWYGLVRADLGLHHSRDAYAAADQALSQAPQSAGAQTAAGLAMYRSGDLAKAETYFRAALKIDQNYPGALTGLASVDFSDFDVQTARDLRLLAWSKSPDDPELMSFAADTLKGAEHIAALEAALARLDPASEAARNLRVRIANDKALANRELRRMVSPFSRSEIKLFRTVDGGQRGFGINLLLNQKETARLLLDPNASGISLSPKIAEMAGLAVVGSEAGGGKDAGDQKAYPLIRYLAASVRVGDVMFEDYPIAAFEPAQGADWNGVIGADVFQRFLVKIDFAERDMFLEPGAELEREASDEPADAAGTQIPGFYRVFRFGGHLAIPTSINGARATLFLIDPGSASTRIDSDIAKKLPITEDDRRMRIDGIPGRANRARVEPDTLVFAAFRMDHPKVPTLSMEKTSDSLGVGLTGAIGASVLDHVAMTIDYRNARIKLEYKKGDYPPEHTIIVIK
jgi:tetratricopeptide (TPR) repeat protein